MFGLGFTEILVILVVALLVFELAVVSRRVSQAAGRTETA